MGTKNLNENGPNPFFLFGTKNMASQSYGNSFTRKMVSTTSISFSMRGRYYNEIAEWKWPPIFQNKRVIYARRADVLELYSIVLRYYQQSTDTNLCRDFNLVRALPVDKHKHSLARIRYSMFVHYVQN